MPTHFTHLCVQRQDLRKFRQADLGRREVVPHGAIASIIDNRAVTAGGRPSESVKDLTWISLRLCPGSIRTSKDLRRLKRTVRPAQSDGREMAESESISERFG